MTSAQTSDGAAPEEDATVQQSEEELLRKPHQSVPGAVWSLIRANKGMWATSALTASVLYYVFPLFPGLVFKVVLDRLADLPVLDTQLAKWLLLLAGIYAIRGATLLIASVAEHGSVIAAGILIRRNLLAGILRRPAARALPESTGDAIGRFTYDQGRVTSIYTWIADPIGQGIALVAALYVLSRVSMSLTLTVALPVLLAAVIANALGHRVQGAREVLQKALGARSSVLGDLFSGVAAIQLGGARGAAVAHLDEANEKVRKATLRDLLISESIQSFSANLGEIGTAALLFMIAGRLRTGEMSVGDLALFVSYIGRLADVGRMAGWFTAQIRQAKVSLVRLAEMVPEEEPAVITRKSPLYLRGALPATDAPSRPPSDALQSLEVEGLTCMHGESGSGVHNLDLSLRRGTVTVVTGEVGAGKTTLLRAVLGLLPTQAGEVRWNGETVEPASQLVPPRVAYSPQVPRCFTATLAENIRLGFPADDEAVRTALESAVMEDDLAQLPDGLLTEVGPRGLRLSGGQLLRTAAARMFVRRPELMVVDDLSSGLDVDTEAELWRRLRAAGGTWLIVSHRPAALALADQVVVLKTGRVVAAGPPSELSSHPFVAHINSGAPATTSAG
ncbi:MAG: ABC transporter ATP-binding protein/permease [Actinobacteria bacterium]|nr:ABC transporter ATP-binding protein/permease [Actinomycetota bacterium]